jgi:tetratricopeptide (TPR) repeat protein
MASSIDRLTQLPDRVGPDRERLLKYKAEVLAHKQSRDMYDGQYYAKLGYNYAAKQYYAKAARSYPKSNLSEEAEKQIADMLHDFEKYPHAISTWISAANRRRGGRA